MAEWVDEVRSACDKVSGVNPVRLDLSQVTYVDTPGTQLLKELLLHGVTVAARSNYVAVVLSREGV